MATFNLDKVHSGIGFQIKHLMISKVKGEFRDFDVQVEGNLDNLEGLKVTVTVDPNRINTNNEDRDNHLRSGDFFEVEKYQAIKSEGESIKKLSDEE